MIDEERRANTLIVAFIGVLTVYLIISAIGCLSYFYGLPLYGIAVSAFYTPFLVAGLKSRFKTSSPIYIFAPVIMSYLSLGLYPSLMVLGMMTTIWLSFRSKRVGSQVYASHWLWIPLYIAGVSILLFGYLLVGNPWADRDVRVALAQPFAFSTFLMLTAACYVDSAPIYLATLLLAGLTSYRTYLANVVFATISARKVGRRFKILLLLVLLVALVGAGYVIAVSGQSWRLSPLGILHYRLSSSLYTLDLIAKRSLPLGSTYGRVLLSSDPRRSIGLLILNSTVKYTYTIYGQPLADFGLLGVVEIYILGIIIRNIWDGERLYQMAPAYLIPMIDAGIDGFRFSVLMILAHAVSKHGLIKKRCKEG